MNRIFLGVEHSATGRVWRDRLDERGSARALAIAQRHDLPELLARILAGRGVEADAVDGFLDPTVRALMPDPNVLTDMPAAAARLADAVERGETVAIFGDYDVDGATSAAMLARFPAPWRTRRRSSTFRTGSSKAMARTSRRSARSPAAARRCSSRSIAAPPATSRWPRRAGSASTSSSSIITTPTRRCRRRARGGQSEPARRSLEARPSRRRRPRLHDHRRGQPRAARARLLERRRGRSPICSACSIWSRSAPSPTWCRSRVSTAPSSPRACWRCAGARMSD